jgi:hypothetical protein
MTEKAITWADYLDYLRQKAGRAALKEAGIADEQITANGKRGQCLTRIEYITLSDTPPWTSRDLEQYDALSGGGVWASLREDDAGETGRDDDRL